MRDPNRISVILKEIEKVWKRNPDLRLGQLIELASCKVGDCPLFYLEDEDLLQGIEKCFLIKRKGLWAKCVSNTTFLNTKLDLEIGKWYEVKRILSGDGRYDHVILKEKDDEYAADYFELYEDDRKYILR